ncbi:MAG: DUF1295 domain-containing protein [Acidobacteriaceae bacterium]
MDIYAVRGRSLAQRAVLTAGLGLCVAAAWWLLVGGGIAFVGGWMGWRWVAGDEVRRVGLGVGLSIYFVRVLFTQFAFLKRAVGWAEVGAIVPWVGFIFGLLAICGGRNTEAFGVVGWIGVAMFGVGSWMNSYSEYARERWKRRAENKGRLYTGGLYRWSRHPNYLGDLVSFSGLCLMAGCWWTGVVPVVMLAGFVFANIPMLDAHLREHYGEEFEAYARRTRRLVPFVY